MTPDERSGGLLYLWFTIRTVACAAILAALGYVPTTRIVGGEGIDSMLAACGICLAGSLIGAIPMALAKSRQLPARTAGQTVLTAVLSSMALRLLVVVVLGVVVALGEWFHRPSLLVWLGISYCGLLVPDTHFALAVLRGSEDKRRL